ncbi:MAG: hypothetical protein K2X29_08745, partial [Candidatus Obscuribacterales bacterium]|nr:hypothetical protein [Candidatus Obscuribacterales bacterium]
QQHGNDKLKVGDHALFLVVHEANDDSPALVSLEDGEKWQELHRAKAESRPVTVTVTRIHRVENNTSKLMVKYKGINGVLPISLLSIPQKEIADLLHKEIEVMVQDASLNTQRLIFNQRRVGQEKTFRQQEMRRNELIESLVPGSILKQVPVHSVFKSASGSEQGILVQLDGSRALIHRSELPHKYLRGSLSQHFQAGDLLDVIVLPFRQKTDGRKEIALSLRAYELQKKKTFLQNIKIGDMLEATLDRRTDYGYFANLSREAEIDGLLHNNEIPIGMDLELGSKTMLKVIAHDPDRFRIGLSMKP